MLSVEDQILQYELKKQKWREYQHKAYNKIKQQRQNNIKTLEEVIEHIKKLKTTTKKYIPSGKPRGRPKKVILDN
jgi:hypothetical protein